MESLSLPFLLGIFIVAASAIWIAGIYLSNTTDILSSRLGRRGVGGNDNPGYRNQSS